MWLSLRQICQFGVSGEGAAVPHRGMPGHSRTVRGTVGPMPGAEWLASDIGRKRFFVTPIALRLTGFYGWAWSICPVAWGGYEV